MLAMYYRRPISFNLFLLRYPVSFKHQVPQSNNGPLYAPNHPPPRRRRRRRHPYLHERQLRRRGGATCQGSAFGNCCSPYGYCGRTAAFCGAGCDPKFGTCDDAGAGDAKVSNDGTCGGLTRSGSTASGSTCKGSAFGRCCSEYGFCGDSDAFCGAGCQAGFGSCNSSAAGSGPGTTDVKATRDGSCGKGNGGTTCAGAGFGSCCSAYGYCGSTSLHCGQGCDPKYGTCSGGGSGSGSSSSASAGASKSSAAPAKGTVVGTTSAAASPTVKATPDGSCGGANGYSCPASQCCSKNGWCGTSDDFCSFGCKAAFGTCQACPGPACSSTVQGGSPACGDDGGKCFVQGGKKFMVNCDGKLASGDWVDGGDTSSINTLAAYVAAYAKTAGYVVANMYTGMGQKSCSLLGSFAGRQTSSGAVGHFAYVKSSGCS
ncbi:hypothetical protein RB596_005872 [Gaeumannomyces avenae]